MVVVTRYAHILVCVTIESMHHVLHLCFFVLYLKSSSKKRTEYAGMPWY